MAKKLNYVSDVSETFRTQCFFNLSKSAAKGCGGHRIKLLNSIRCLAHYVIACGLAEIELVDYCAVVEESASNKTDLFERSDAPVDSYQIAFSSTYFPVQLLDAGWNHGLCECRQNCDSRLGDA